ncbi:MAG: Gfo/Idh/MocA family oxidoreductase [Chitinophagaceae bacterium]|nr:Gfo/Idh/MocA family oxidoreductase [Chitinophagaceae bacterium]
MAAEKIRFAVIGLGHIGRLHATILSQHRQAELVAVCDENLSLREFKDRGVGHFFSSVESLLSSSVDFDVLSIATPNGLHERHALLALEAGKHVVIEKPMALSVSGCRKIIDLAARQKRRVFCVMQNRYAGASRWLKKLIDTNVPGKIYMANISCYWNRDDKYYKSGGWHGSKHMDGGPLFTQFSHFIDTILWLFGNVNNIYARFADFNHSRLTESEDSGTFLFDLENGGAGCFQYTTSCWDRNLGSRITIVAENGSVEVEGQYMENIGYCHIKGYEPVVPARYDLDGYDLPSSQLSNHHYFFEDVIAMLQQRPGVAATAVDGLNTVRLIEQVYQFYKP